MLNGSFGLHIAHGAWKAEIIIVGWVLNKFAATYPLSKDNLARHLDCINI